MRLREIIICETTYKLKYSHLQLDDIKKLKPQKFPEGWRIIKPNADVTGAVKGQLNSEFGSAWQDVVDAINELRSLCGLKAKAFKAPDAQERAEFVATKPATLLHGTSRAASEKIMQEGLRPQVGEFVRRTYGSGTSHKPIVFAGVLKDFHRMVAAMYVAAGSPQDDNEFFDTAALLVLANDGKWFQEKDGHPSPETVEGGDFYRYEPIMPKRAIVGAALRKFFDEKVGQMPSDFVDFIESSKR